MLLLLSPPVVSAPAPRVTLPAPASEPMVSSKPARSRVARSRPYGPRLAEKLSSAPACRVPCCDLRRAAVVAGPAQGLHQPAAAVDDEAARAGDRAGEGVDRAGRATVRLPPSVHRAVAAAGGDQLTDGDVDAVDRRLGAVRHLQEGGAAHRRGAVQRQRPLLHAEDAAQRVVAAQRLGAGARLHDEVEDAAVVHQIAGEAPGRPGRHIEARERCRCRTAPGCPPRPRARRSRPYDR